VSLHKRVVIVFDVCSEWYMSRHTAGYPSEAITTVLPTSDCAIIVSIRYASTGHLRLRCQAYIGASSAAYAMEEETV
jgi:hypothetical protein